MKCIKKFLLAFFCSAFRVGNNQDGLFSALQVFLVLLSATVAISIAGRFQIGPLNLHFVQLCKASLLSLTFGIMGMWMFQGIYQYCKNRRNGQEGYRVVEENTQLTLKELSKLLVPLIGMLLFMAGAIVIDIEGLIACGTCLNDHLSMVPNICVWYHSMKILFFMAVFLLCISVSIDSQKKRRFLLENYGLSMILAMVIWLAIDCQLNESQDLFKRPTFSCEAMGLYNFTTVVSETDMIHHSCECEMLGVYKRFHQVSEYLYPFITEFCLLISECILHRLFHHATEAMSPHAQVHQGLSFNRFQQTFAFLLALILGVVHIVLQSYWSVPDKFGEGPPYTLALYIYRISYSVVLILVTKIGFFFASDMDVVNGGYTGYEMLVMFSAFGQYLFHMFDLAGLGTSMYVSAQPSYYSVTTTATAQTIIANTKSASVLHMVLLALSIYQTYTQTSFMLHALKLKARDNERSTCEVVKACLTFLALSNLLLWVLYSFIKLKGLTQLYPVESTVYTAETWTTLSEIIFPIMVFYRFNSAIIMTGAVLTY